MQPKHLLTILDCILSYLLKFSPKKKIILKWLNIVLKNLKIFEINTQKYEEILTKFNKNFSDIPSTLRNIHFFKGKYNLIIKEQNYENPQKSKKEAFLKKNPLDKEVLIEFKKEKPKKIQNKPKKLKKIKKIKKENNKNNSINKKNRKRNDILTSESLSDSGKKNAFLFQQNNV